MIQCLVVCEVVLTLEVGAESKEEALAKAEKDFSALKLKSKLGWDIDNRSDFEVSEMFPDEEG
jgi:hypothetical protein